jgi:Lon-like protease
VALLLFTAFLVSAAWVPLPWYAFRPGSVRDTEPLLSVGGDTRTYPSDGSIGYTTVSLRQTTLFGLIQGWIDDDVDIHPEDEVLGDRDAEENRSFNLQLMDNSKSVATQVALEHLGYDVTVTSTGSTVLRVEPDSPADGKLEVGDTIVAVGDEPINDPEDLPRLMDDKAPGDRVTVTAESLDGDRRRDVTMTLTPAPDDPDRGVMGVLVQPRDLDYDFPVDVQIETGDVGGPSAGLAFTLAILDDLTAGELTGGEPVAVTGEILADGTVGAIGGTAQKAAAVRQAGIDVFIVPTADYDDAVTRAGDVEVIAVDTLDDALEALGDLGGNADDLPRVGEEAPARGH